MNVNDDEYLNAREERRNDQEAEERWREERRPTEIECSVKIYNVPERVKNGMYGCWIVARYTSSDHKWWYFSVFKEANRAIESAKSNDGYAFYYKKGDKDNE